MGDLEPAVVYRSLLERLRKYDPYDPKARAMALRVLLQLPIRTDSFTESQPNQLNNRLRSRVIISAKVRIKKQIFERLSFARFLSLGPMAFGLSIFPSL